MRVPCTMREERQRERQRERENPLFGKIICESLSSAAATTFYSVSRRAVREEHQMTITINVKGKETAKVKTGLTVFLTRSRSK